MGGSENYTFDPEVSVRGSEAPSAGLARRAHVECRDASKVEIKVLNLLRERDPHNMKLVSSIVNHRGVANFRPYSNCIHLVDWFDDRNHICIVTELLSVSVFDFLKENNYTPFPGSQIQHFAKQLLKSVACA